MKYYYKETEWSTLIKSEREHLLKPYKFNKEQNYIWHNYALDLVSDKLAREERLRLGKPWTLSYIEAINVLRSRRADGQLDENIPEEVVEYAEFLVKARLPRVYEPVLIPSF